MRRVVQATITMVWLLMYLIFKDGKIVEPFFDGEIMETIVKISKSHGLSWGDDWKIFKDYPHFNNSFEYIQRQLFNKVNNNDMGNGYVKLSN